MSCTCCSFDRLSSLFGFRLAVVTPFSGRRSPPPSRADVFSRWRAKIRFHFGVSCAQRRHPPPRRRHQPRRYTSYDIIDSRGTRRRRSFVRRRQQQREQRRPLARRTRSGSVTSARVPDAAAVSRPTIRRRCRDKIVSSFRPCARTIIIVYTYRATRVTVTVVCRVLLPRAFNRTRTVRILRVLVYFTFTIALRPFPSGLTIPAF